MRIRELPSGERPREKMQRHGSAALSSGELLAILLRTGTREKTALALAEELLAMDPGGLRREMSELTKKGGEAFSRKGNNLFLKIEKLPIPVIAAVNGYALGGGCELSMACDIRLASENAVFGQPEAGLGITPGFGGTQRLARLIGTGRAKEIIYATKNIKADEAYRIGLVNHVYPADQLMDEAKKLAGRIAGNAPIAVRQCKVAINEGIQTTIDSAVALEEKYFGDCFETHDQKEGMGAFLEKRKEKHFTNN